MDNISIIIKYHFSKDTFLRDSEICNTTLAINRKLRNTQNLLKTCKGFFATQLALKTRNTIYHISYYNGNFGYPDTFFNVVFYVIHTSYNRCYEALYIGNVIVLKL